MAKEGDNMKKYSEFDILEKADDSITGRIAQELPPRDEKETERIFMMSEKKYNARISGSADFEPEQTVSGVEHYRQPRWLRVAAAAAACLGLISAAVGGAYMLRGMKDTGKQLSTGQTEETAIAGEQSIAPFGDFEDMEFYIPDYTRSGVTRINVPETGGYHEVPPGDVISKDKRRALADFFNDYNWVEANSDRVTGEVEEFCRFICNDGSTVTSLSFYTNDIMVYLRMEYHEEDGLLVRSEDVRYTDYAIDSELFAETISNILETDTSEYSIADAPPFGDFSVLGYYIPTDPEPGVQMYIDDNSTLDLCAGEIISQEKRDKMAELFNSYDWGTWEVTDVLPYNTNFTDQMTFTYWNESEIRVIYLNGDSNTLIYDRFEYFDEDDHLRCTDYSSWAVSIDYDYFKEKLSEIINEEDEEVSTAASDVTELPFSDFAELDYYVPEENGAEYSTLVLETNSDGNTIFRFITPGDPIVQEKREKILEFFNNCDWEYWDRTIPDEADTEAEPKSDAMSFIYCGDTEIRLIYIEGASNRIGYCVFEYVEENGELRCTNYEDCNKWIAKIDYDYVSAGLQEILGSD